MEWVEFLIMAFLEMLALCIVLASVRKNEKGIRQWGMAVFLGTTVMSLINFMVSTTIVCVTVDILVVFFIIRNIYNLKLKEIVVLFVYAWTIVFGIQVVVTLIVSRLVVEFEFAFAYGFLINVITVGIMVIFYFKMPLTSVYYFITHTSKWFDIIMINIFMMYYIFMICWYTDCENFMSMTFILFGIIVTVGLINIYVIRDGLINEHLLEKDKIYSTYLPVIENMIEELKVKQHDYHNHLQTLEVLKYKSDLDNEVYEYIEKISDIGLGGKLFKLNDSIIMAFLYSKYIDGMKKGVKLEFDFSSYDVKTECSKGDLVEILGILIDNAIEATRENQGECINIYIDKEDGRKVFRIENYVKNLLSKDLEYMFKKNYSTKKSKGHGIGLGKLKKMIEREKGTIEVINDTMNEKIVFTINLP